MNFDADFVTIGLVALYFRIFDFSYLVRGAPPERPRMKWWVTAIAGDDGPSKSLATARLGHTLLRGCRFDRDDAYLFS
jgi:hypothetical protein